MDDLKIGDNQAECIELLANIEDRINQFPEEAREIYWETFKRDLLIFSGLLDMPILLEIYTTLSTHKIKGMLAALDGAEGKR